MGELRGAFLRIKDTFTVIKERFGLSVYEH
jgi:hypothetical protein